MATRNWLWLLVAGMLVRLAIAPFFYGFQYDMDTFGSWARTLVTEPFRAFYAVAESPDHLPGDLYLHYLLGSLFELAGGQNFHGEAYRFLLKVIPALADLLIALLIWYLLRRLVTETIARLAAVGYMLNPATIFLTAVWGQWDAVSGLIMLVGLGVLWLRPDRWVLAIPLFAWCVMIKPPLALLCLIGLLVMLLGEMRKGGPLSTVIQRQLANILVAAIVGLGVMALLLAPFDTGLTGTWSRWSLADRVGVAVDLYPYTTLGAANIWMIPLGSPDRQSDQDGTLAGLTEQGWGTLLFLGALIYVGFVLIRRQRSLSPVPLVVWAMVVANYAYFLFPTRSHERYMYPAVLLLVVLAGLLRLDSRVLRLTVAVSVVYALNLVGVYFNVPGILEPALFLTLSVANILLFAIVTTLPFWLRGEVGDVEAAGTSAVLRADEPEPVLR